MVAQVLPWSLNGGTVVATVIAQWTPLVGQRRHNGGTKKADVSLTLIHNVRIFYWATNGRPLCLHSATTAMCVPSSCLLWATCERPTSSATLVRLFWTCSKLHGDHGVHGDVWTTLDRPRQPFGLPYAFNGDLASLVVAQGRHKGRSPCVKGVLLITLGQPGRPGSAVLLKQVTLTSMHVVKCHIPYALGRVRQHFGCHIIYQFLNTIINHITWITFQGKW